MGIGDIVTHAQARTDGEQLPDTAFGNEVAVIFTTEIKRTTLEDKVPAVSIFIGRQGSPLGKQRHGAQEQGRCQHNTLSHRKLKV